MRVGAVTFVAATVDAGVHWNGAPFLEEGTRIIGVEAPSSTDSASNGDVSSQRIVSIGNDLQLYRDSIATLPKKLSDADAISTAATSLLGVHCSNLPLTAEDDAKRRKKVVIVGGGDYAQFLAKALVGLGNEVSLVSARPGWSLPSPADIAPSKGDEGRIEVLPPAVGQMSLGFAAAVGEFDALVDTLGDELGMGRAMSVVDNCAMADESSFMEQLRELHGCSNYMSTLTRSQQ